MDESEEETERQALWQYSSVAFVFYWKTLSGWQGLVWGLQGNNSHIQCYLLPHWGARPLGLIPTVWKLPLASRNPHVHSWYSQICRGCNYFFWERNYCCVTVIDCRWEVTCARQDSESSLYHSRFSLRQCQVCYWENGIWLWHQHF